jgi:hypothetical protein
MLTAMNDNNQQKIAEITERLKKKIEEKEDTAVYHLPFWQQDKRGAPNSFLRSALFAAIQSKDRIFIKDKTLFSQQGITVKFTGERLNQEDMSVWLTLVDLARENPLGNECDFTAYEILKHLGLEDGGDQRQRLLENTKRLAACLIEIRVVKRGAYYGSLVDDFYVEEGTDHYKLTLNKKLINIFGDNDWTSLDFGQRKELRQKPLAQKLHEYYSSHERPLPITIDFLHKLVGSANKAIRSFKPKLKAALEELITIGFLASYTIEGDKVTVERKFSRALPQTKTRE